MYGKLRFTDKTTDSDGDDLSGTTYSDTAVGGSKASTISDMVTLTAGGDFGVAVKETGFSSICTVTQWM